MRQSDRAGNSGDGARSNGQREVLDSEAFNAYLAARLAEIADVEVVGREGQQLQLLVEGTPVRSDMGRIYELYREQPDRLTAIAEAFVEALVGVRPDVQDVKYSQVQDRLMPMLKPAGFVRAPVTKGLLAPVNRPFLAGLVITCVIDEPRTVAYVNHEHLGSWDLDEDRIFDQALGNLEEITGEDSYTRHGEGPESLLIAQAGDGYDATRLLLPDLMNAWAGQVPGRLLLGLPDRDFLIGFSDRDAAIVRRIAGQVRQDARESEHPLTDQLLVWREGQFDEYEGGAAR